MTKKYAKLISKSLSHHNVNFYVRDALRDLVPSVQFKKREK